MRRDLILQEERNCLDFVYLHFFDVGEPCKLLPSSKDGFSICTLGLVKSTVTSFRSKTDQQSVRTYAVPWQTAAVIFPV